MDSYYLGLGILVGTALVIYLLGFSLYRHLIPKHQNDFWTGMIVSSSLALSLLSVLILPFDIFILSQGEISAASFTVSGRSMQELYFILLGVLLVLAYVGIPFSYFYVQNLSKCEREEEDLSGVIRIAFRRTLAFIAGLLILLFLGLKFFASDENDEWNVRKLLDLNHGGYRAIAFSWAVLTLFGSSVWMTYSAFGTASLPIVWLRGPLSKRRMKESITNDITELRARQRAIQGNVTSHKMSENDVRELKRLEIMQAHLSKHSYKLQEADTSSHFFSNLFTLLVPFRLLIGHILLILAASLLASLIFVTYQKLTYSECGAYCGFAFSPTDDTLMPLDSVLLYLSKYFPLDFFVYGILVLYVFGASLYGVIKLGIPFANSHIQARKSSPAGVLILCLIMIHVVTSMQIAFLTIAPGYTTYGTQTFTPDNGSGAVLCLTHIHKPLTEETSNCLKSAPAIIVEKISTNIPFFLIFFFLSNICYIAVSLYSFIYSAFIAQAMPLLQQLENTLEIDEENHGLLQLSRNV